MKKDFSELDGLITKKFKNRSRFAKAWGKTPEYLWRRMNNVTEFNSTDIVEIADLLCIAPQDISTYFLTPLFDYSSINTLKEGV